MDKHEYFLTLATHVASRSTCPRKAVGCVLIDKNSNIKATGFNGVPRKFPHCNEEHCGGQAGDCLAVHAEQNALLQCADVHAIKAMYVTLSPCHTCAKLILNTSIKLVIYKEEYRCTKGIDLLKRMGVGCVKLSDQV